MGEHWVPAREPLTALWGKSDAGGQPMPLLQHLLDTAAVGELLWDRFLAPGFRSTWEAATSGQGRGLFSLLCGLHDIGKATPAFQSKVPELADAVRAVGLTWRRMDKQGAAWHHTLAGARILGKEYPHTRDDAPRVPWLWPLIAGHHGVIPGAKALERTGWRTGHGAGQEWRRAQQHLVDAVLDALELEWKTLASTTPPPRASQLALLGHLVMADWIASDVRHFPGNPSVPAVSMAGSRERACQAWDALGLRGGWNPARLAMHDDLVEARFQRTPRPFQETVDALVRSMDCPGLVLVEAPMGEGKTEAALAAAEVLAQRTGADGLFVGMPTQATSDPMFGRVREWAQQLDPSAPVALLHGKARFNAEWRALRSANVQIAGVDEFGCEDAYGTAGSAQDQTAAGQAPPEWLLGNKRGLLTPVTVGTIDQLLHAATRTRHVMLRHAGLCGKVVVLDEVHAYDVYMSQFLHEALRWLAQAGVPVVALSATLAPEQRRSLARAYLQGMTVDREVDVAGLPAPSGYPSVTSVGCRATAPAFAVRTAAPWRNSTRVSVEVLEEDPDRSAEDVVDVLREALSAGGHALVIRNTVARAQDTFTAVREAFGDDVILLHSRLTAATRAERSQRVLDLLGPGRRQRSRLVVVATQVAEQSFDVDADLLVTDLAPVDLLLQRAGRLHRHKRPPHERPGPVRDPRVVVTGVQGGRDSAPSFPRGSRLVYGEHLLLRSAALVDEAVSSHAWSIPEDIPGLVGRCYADDFVFPGSWSDTAERARSRWEAEQRLRRERATGFLLAGDGELGVERTLAGLQERPLGALEDDDVAVVVRDGDESIEVVLVRLEAGSYVSVDGVPLGPGGVAVSDPDVLECVVGDAVRLPSHIGDEARELRPLAAWNVDPWLGRARALVLDENWTAVVGQWRVTYDRELGIRAQQLRTKPPNRGAR